jgi:hypothetical protein
MMEEIIKEAESKNRRLQVLASDSHDHEKCISSADEEDMRLTNSMRENNFISQQYNDALLEFDSWTYREHVEPAVEGDCVAYSESLRLTDLVGEEYLDVFDTSMEDFADQLRGDLDKLSEKVLGNDEGSNLSMEGSDVVTPCTKARDCVEALAFFGLEA